MLTIQVEIKTITKLGPMWISRSFFSRKERQPRVCICRDVMFSSWDVAEIKAVITLWVRPLMRIWIDRRWRFVVVVVVVVVVVTIAGFE
jgi:hypothetical protein